MASTTLPAAADGACFVCGDPIAAHSRLARRRCERAPLAIQLTLAGLAAAAGDAWAGEVLAAASEALEEAINLATPHQSTGRCLTVSSVVNVAVCHPERAGWAADRLRQLAHEWQAGR
jgi:hypothetical protein